ncbi:MAG: DUF3017 domain-containing protein [Propionibacteriaceae bacterium]|jgi:hypothetical protein|nr:DUF3017 domain-containing protein [Propionibacteriaceae bacterium]
MSEPAPLEPPRRSWWAGLSDNPGLLGRIRRQWPWVVVLVCMAVGLTLIAITRWRWGAGAIGAGMVAAGVFRTVMRDPGIVAIRGHRFIDLVFYYGIGLAIIVFAIIVPTP